jgi:hypothetical protein
MVMLLIGLTLSACTRIAPIPPPVEGPAVVGDGVEIEAWEYLGPDMYGSQPPLPADAIEVGNDIYDVRLLWKKDGFDLVWSTFLCATQPVVVVHADASIEFWPGESVEPRCVAMGVSHMLTVKMHTSIPPEQWKFTLHPPPEPEA